MNESTDIKELFELKNVYEQDKYNLLLKKKKVYKQIIEVLKSEIDYSPNSERLQNYLETAHIRDFNFLYRSLLYMPGNNMQGRLTFEELLLLDEYVKGRCLEYNIASRRALYEIFCDYNDYHRVHPLLEDGNVWQVMKRSTTLIYLDDIFKNIDNVLNYQGSYTVYRYVKRYLKAVLKEDFLQTDEELIYKDYDQKLELVFRHLADISSYLLEKREEIPAARLAICNSGLSRMARKSARTGITFNQNVFAKGIAFGTTLEKLKDENYEDAESLIFLPHQKILK